ncbi:MAG TPA: hypothetical protein VD793_11015 [Gemmatimonadales bacterium]|nr:hypothetical protein [Gemmatimonadales bacterium]
MRRILSLTTKLRDRVVAPAGKCLCLVTLAACASLLLAPEIAGPAEAQRQPKHKDPVLEQYLIREFAKLHTRLDEMGARVAALEAELTQSRERQTEALTNQRTTQDTLKTLDTAVANVRASTAQDAVGLKTDMAALRQDVSRITDFLARMVSQQFNPGGGSALNNPPPAGEERRSPDRPAIEGYITAVADTGITISLGSSAGVTVGMRFNVYRAADPRTQIGVIEIVEILDSNNSRAAVYMAKPETKFEFSDIVRPAT